MDNTKQAMFNVGQKVRVKKTEFSEGLGVAGYVFTVKSGPEGSDAGGNYYFAEIDYVIFGDELETLNFKPGDIIRFGDHGELGGTVMSEEQYVTYQADNGSTSGLVFSQALSGMNNLTVNAPITPLYSGETVVIDGDTYDLYEVLERLGELTPIYEEF